MLLIHLGKPTKEKVLALLAMRPALVSTQRRSLTVLREERSALRKNNLVRNFMNLRTLAFMGLKKFRQLAQMQK